MNVAEFTTAARSRIEDADFAAESARLAKARVLQQTGTAMLAQANASSQLSALANSIKAWIQGRSLSALSKNNNNIVTERSNGGARVAPSMQGRHGLTIYVAF